jgi:uncharacterized alpha-E superfamily protein
MSQQSTSSLIAPHSIRSMVPCREASHALYPLVATASCDCKGGRCRVTNTEVARFHGLTSSTMMRGEAYGFYLLGTFVERADMTARILDVKYHILLPDATMVGSPLDYYQWAALLKSLSGFEAYRRKYHTGMRPIDVAQHAIFEGDFPRSLQFAVDRIQRALEMISTSTADNPSHQAVGRLRAHLEHHSAEIVLREGFHEFLQGFLGQMAALNAALQVDYFAAHFGAEPCTT